MFQVVHTKGGPMEGGYIEFSPSRLKNGDHGMGVSIISSFEFKILG